MRESVKSSVAVLATAVLALTLAGCGGDKADEKTAGATTAPVSNEALPPTPDVAASDDTNDASESDMCALLDNSTITTITGVDYSAVVPADDGSGTCTWDLTSLGGASMVSVIAADTGGSTFQMNRDVAASMFEDVTDVSVAGSDDAFTYMGGWVLAMDLGGDYVQVMYMNMSLGEETTDPEVLTNLAEEVAANW